MGALNNFARINFREWLFQKQEKSKDKKMSIYILSIKKLKNFMWINFRKCLFREEEKGNHKEKISHFS